MTTDIESRGGSRTILASRRDRLVVLGGLVLAVALGATPFAKLLAPGDGVSSMVVREALYWGEAAILLAWLVKVERRPLSSIGLRWTGWRGVAIGVAAGLLLIVIQIAHFTVLVPALGLDPQAAVGKRAAILHMPFALRVALVVRAAVVEEIVYRGMMIEGAAKATGRTAIGVIVSILVFTYAHLSGWGAVHLIPVAASGVVLALLYAWRRDLPSNMIGHFMVDAVGFLA